MFGLDLETEMISDDVEQDEYWKLQSPIWAFVKFSCS